MRFLVCLTTATTAAQVLLLDTCEQTPNVVYGNGENLNGTESMAGSALECCAVCQANHHCTSYAYGANKADNGAEKHKCYLHGGDPNADVVQKPDRISGRVRTKATDDDDAPTPAPPSPAPPPPTPAAPPLACQGTGDAAAFAFCDGAQPLAARVADFVRRINDTDKPKILTARSPVPLPALAGTPGYYWGTNCIQSVENGAHGESVPCAGKTCSTKFPSPPGWMASFNRSSMAAMARTMAVELRALYNTGHAKGLDCWGPVLNLARDPRWGRNGEAGAECPYLMGQFALMWTRGFQYGALPGDDVAAAKARRPLLGAVCLKHWAANTLEGGAAGEHGETRHNFNVNVSNWVLQDGYFPAFRGAAIDGARGAMCSYNAVQGTPACTSPMLKAQLGAWNFTGYVSSDTDAVKDAYAQHHAYPDGEAATCAALTAGRTDINSGNTYSEHLLAALAARKCNMSAVDAALANTLRVRFELGLFDKADATARHTALNSLDLGSVGTAAGKALSAQAARESLVLLTNPSMAAAGGGGGGGGKVLPFAPGGRVAVVGPLADDATALMGIHFKTNACGNGADTSCIPTPLTVLRAALGADAVPYAAGSAVDAPLPGGIAAAVAAANNATRVVLVLGITSMQEKESHDRASIDLPADQHALAAAVLALGKPTAIVLVNGGAVSVGPEAAAGNAAILEAFTPGPQGAQAVADALFGVFSPGGKLPFTVYDANWTATTPMDQMDMMRDGGRTYRFYEGKPLFAFGHGLSFSSFGLSWAEPPPAVPEIVASASSGGALQLAVAVENTGAVTADEVVMAFWSPQTVQVNTPVKRQMFDFQRLSLAAGGKATAAFSVDALSLQMADPATGALVSSPGSYVLTFGNGNDAWLSLNVRVTGDAAVVIEPFPQQ
jgi:beta-glucosidase-like glycosyl hydrolase